MSLVIKKNNPYAHVESGKIYTVVAMGARIKYERDSDGKTYELSPDQFKVRFRELTDTELEIRNADNTDRGVGLLIEPSDTDTLDRLVLPVTVVESALDGLRLVTVRDRLDEIWNLSTVMPLKGRCVMNFYGPPGTGKTALVKALAKIRGVKIYQVDYAAIISKWVGDTVKHIKQAFAEAKTHDAILFFDEADSLLSRRVTDMSEAFSTSINQNRNVLMQELDRHNGTVICATNMIRNYDEAILRRIIKHVKFDLPDETARTKIFKLHFPRTTNVDISEAGWTLAGEISGSMSGGDILTTAVNAMLAGSKHADHTQWRVDSQLLEAEINNTLKVKADHGNEESAQQLVSNIGE